MLIDRTSEDDRVLQNILSSFSCVEDEDIEKFLHTKSVEFERLSKSRTYLIIDQDQLDEQGMTLDRLCLYGYISLAVKVLTVPEKTSNRQRHRLDGFSAKEHGKQIANFPCYLIGQLARNSNVAKTSLSGTELLSFAFDIIALATEAVGGRYILIECHDHEKLMRFYRDNDFTEISRIPDEEKTMVQMIRKI